MAAELAAAFTLPAEGVSSQSGEWTLRYREDGVAAIVHSSGTQTWVAGGSTPVAGELMLENNNRLTVRSDQGVRWDSGPLLPLPEPGESGGYDSPRLMVLRVTDTGDGVLVNPWRLPRYSLLDGDIEPVSLGDRAPIAAIRDHYYLRSGQGERVVAREPDGSLVHYAALGFNASVRHTVSAPEAYSLELDGTELTWRFVGEPGRRQWELVLLEGARLRWNLGPPIVDAPACDEVSVEVASVRMDTPAPVRPSSTARPDPVPVDAPYTADWAGAGGLDVLAAYCVTAIQDVDPDEALRRLGPRISRSSPRPGRCIRIGPPRWGRPTGCTTR